MKKSIYLITLAHISRFTGATSSKLYNLVDRILLSGGQIDVYGGGRVNKLPDLIKQ
jgi:hypothetical protein